MTTIARPKQKTYSLDELFTLEFPPENHIIGSGLLSKNSIMAVAAPPKSYKSFSTNTMLVELLIGSNLFGVTRAHARTVEEVFPIQQINRVLLIEQEIGLQDTQARLRELVLTLPAHQQEIVRKGFFVRSCDYELKADKAIGMQRIAALIEETKPDIVCIDPLAKFHTSEENSPSEMGRIMLNLRELIHKYDITIILIHHTGKVEEGKATLDLLRGASSIAADIDTGMILHVINKPASIIWVDIELRRGKPIPPFKIKLNHQTLRTEFAGWAKAKASYASEAVTESLKMTDTQSEQ